MAHPSMDRGDPDDFCLSRWPVMYSPENTRVYFRDILSNQAARESTSEAAPDNEVRNVV